MNRGTPVIALPELESVRRLRESRERSSGVRFREGGPGSGPRKSVSLGMNNIKQGGKNDKVYHIQLDKHPSGGGYAVNFQFGRRGGGLQKGTKTPDPVPYEKANQMFHDLHDSKVQKGYKHIGESTREALSVKQVCPNCNGPLNQMGECAHCGEAQEGGPGSGPQGGRNQRRTTPEMARKAGGGVKSTADKEKGDRFAKSLDRAQHAKQVQRGYDTGKAGDYDHEQGTET